MHKEQQEKMTYQELDSFHSIQSPDDDPTDSDLFFDFDIESPDQDFHEEDEDEESSSIILDIDDKNNKNGSPAFFHHHDDDDGCGTLTS